MTGTLTLRLSGSAMRRIRARAKALGVTPSELVRMALEHEISEIDVPEASAFELTRKWVGSISSTKAPAGREARAELERWNPDRRG